MELYKEILTHALAQGEITITYSHGGELSQILESRCYKALEKIKTIIEDDSLTDRDCFLKIEQIVCALEQIGSSGGSRHDFG